jgi:hypothetical protein
VSASLFHIRWLAQQVKLTATSAFRSTKQILYPIGFGIISAGSLAGGLGAVVIFFTTGSVLYTERAARFGRFINLWLRYVRRLTEVVRNLKLTVPSFVPEAAPLGWTS